MVALSINGGLTTVVVKPGGAVFVNWIYTQLPISAANVTIFRPSSSFILMETNFGLQLEIQLIPIMQLSVHLDPSFKGKTCGLCGNFDSRQIDDFRAISGVVEGTAPAFANTWKTQAICPNIKQNFEDPCSLSIENEKYAHHWCGLLTDSEGPFGKCHSSLNPATYHENCMFDTCNCERSEDCMCAALSAYVRACAAKGVELPGWRTNVCAKYMTCPKSLDYSYTISSCTPTCRSLSEPDVTCQIEFVPVDGCTCTNGTYMNDDGKCVPANQCPCYYRGTAVLPGEVLHDTGAVCTCAQGKLNCIGDGDLKPVCIAPMVYFDCKNATTGNTGAECQKSCQTLDMQCYSTQCMSGCMCPTGLVSDGKGKCIAMEECPCIHNDVTYNPGEKIKVDCNTCVCKDRMWKCTKDKCLGTCAVYGDGHYITFDDKRYNFNGKCEYTLVQDHCGQNNFTQGTFRIITENIPCGSTGTTCSKSIKVFLENYELILSEEQSKVITRGGGGDELPYRIRYMGIYLVIETINRMIILWDKKTSIFIKISPDFKGQVCGLCGNYDGNGINDFTTRSQSIVGDVLEFGNSWKVSPTCPDAKCIKDPCSKNPYRKSWSQKQCSIINSKVFAACHSQVEPTKYYESCVTDACACDTGGDCECFCTAVAAYAQACSEFGVCVSWRTPSVCPMFCDYYNAERECDWHYKPCGAPCMKTCRNPSGRCLYQLPGLEGCYPHCPADKPYFNEEEMKCVDQCGCYDAEDNYYPLGTHFDLRDTCQSCMCTSEGIMCNYDGQACYCHYEGKEYIYKEVIYNTTDGMGWCMTATCDVNGTIHRDTYRCVGTTTLPPFTFTTIPSTSGAESTTPATTTCVHKQCQWSEWYDVSYPRAGENNGDYETPDTIRAKGHNICKFPDEVECRAEHYTNVKIEDLNQNIQCTKDTGLICNNKDQMPPICYNYQIKFLCCIYTPCEISSPTTPYVPISTTLQVTKLTPEGTMTHVSSTVVGTTTIVTPVGTTTSSMTESISTVCQPECTWTAWFDVSDPENGEGDMETPEEIRKAGKQLCDNPQNIECRAQLYHNVPISQLQQKVLCNIKDGLQCRDREQMGKMKKCLNYEARFYCCDYAHCRTTSTQGTMTIATSTSTEASTPSTTLGQTSASPSSSAGSTPGPTLRPSTQGTTVATTSPGKETTTTLSTSLSTAQATSPGAVSTPSVTSATASTATATSLQSTPVSKPTGSIPTEGTTPQISSTAIGTTTIVTPIGSTTSSVTEAISTICQPECTWTAWFDVSDPENGEGDMETPEEIRKAGKQLCDNPQNIECRAQLYHDVPISQLQQKVLCNIKDGLQCRDREQMGKMKKCLNYEARFYCCDYAHCRTTSTQGTMTIATSSSTEASTPSTTLGQTSASPSSSAGSTTGPTLRPSTPGTTLVATSPGKETTTTLSTSLSTAQPTSPGAVSTPSVTSATASTATATSLQSTPVSKPTGSIPTEGTTPQVSSTAVGTTTVVTPIGSTTSSVTEAISTICQPECTWTAWFDVSDPENGEGDMETPEEIRKAGKQLCDNPQNIECRAQLYHDVPISQLQQKVLCNIKDGLQCRDWEQMGKMKKCLNYEARFYCCDYAHCRTTSTQGTMTTATSTSTEASTHGTTLGQTSASPSSSAGSTTGPTLRPSTPGTTLVATSPGKETTTTLSTSLSTAQPTSPGAVSTPSVTSATASTATATSLQSTPVSKPTGSIPTEGTTPQISSTAIGTTTIVTPIGSTTSSVTEAISTICQPECTWTAWFDVSDPENGEGDMETPEEIRKAGKQLCDNPQNIECRAQLYHDVPISQLQQKVLCNIKDGLQCRDREQMGKMKKCLNYEARFYCCDYAHCRTTSTQGTMTIATSSSTEASTPSTTLGQTSASPSSSAGSTTGPTLRPSTPGTTLVATSPGKETTTTLSTSLSTTQPTSPGVVSTPSVTSATASTATATSLQSTPVSKPTESIPTEGTTPQVSSTAVGTTTVVTPIGSTTSSVTEAISTICQPECTWTAWFDVSDPENGEGDMETPEEIRKAGKQLCDNPQNIECRAQLYHDVPISQLQQKVLCNIKDGLQCRDWEQMGKMKKCLNYEARFYCCDYAHCRTTSTQGTMTTATSTSTEASTHGTTLGQTSASPSSSAGSTTGPTLRPSTPGTTLVATSPGKETTTTLSTSLSTAQPTSPGAVSTPSVTSATASTATATSLQSTPVSKPTGSIPTEGTTPQISSTAVGTTTIVTPIGSTTSSVTEAISTICQPECTWTVWFDVSDPENGEGDMETPEEIRKAGKQLCDNPQNIECRAQLYHDVPISQLQQKVLCNIKDGLQCRDREQMGKMKKCLNYEARFYCCDYAHCRTTSTQGTMTIATSSSTEASTPGTTLGQTSASPSSSAGSTPGPTLRPSTQGTTVATTSPGKETTTTLSTSLSTAQATSPGAVSTPSVTSATASTATATSLQSTPVSKPTGSIPTEGTTPQVSSTAVGTTTVVTPIGSTTSSVTEAISTICQPECTWTAWFDVSDPENGEGDMETPEEIRKAGKQLCDNPQNIECRAQLYHDVPISQLQQKVLCNIKDGLQCRDREQMGKMKKCLNYEARFYCCDYAHCRTTSTQGTMTIATSSSTEASTHGTTLGQTSASPSSSAGSTPGPTLRPSTQGTTVATTSPGKETTTTLSTSLSTAQATSPGAVSTPSVTSATASTATATSLQSTPVSKPTGSIPTEGTTPQISSTAIGTTTIITPIGSTTSSVTEAISTICQPECTWTAWFDVSDPENGEGDMETPEEIRKAGKQLCDNPQNIECRAQLYHDVPISQLQQKVLCNIKDGLQCRDREQMGKMKKCLNYEARFYCCDYAHCRTTSTQGTMTIATSSSTEASTPSTTLGQTSASPSSSSGSTPGPTLRPSTQGTTVATTSPGKETTTTLSTSLSTAQATSPGAVSTPSVTSATASTATATSLQSTPVSKPTGSIPTEGTTPQISSTAIGTTTIITPIGSTTSSVTEAISTVCQPECTWTAWFDVSDPENGEGDMETPEEIRKAGKQLCDNPQNIECRAQLYHDVPISQLQQKVLCNIKDGLQCRDREQMGKMKKCLNYEARFYCCDYAHCRTTSTQGTMTIATSSSTEASTPSTTLGQTSASPSSSAGSTPGPTLRPSTQGTTVATTSPGKETTTTLSTSLSNAQPTSPGAVSTPSVTSATASTATATSLQSTPVSKPTGSIPTEGTTPQVSSTAVGTTTVVTPIGSTTSSVTEAISTICQPECTWTAWFDVSDPENGEGDMETPEEIRKAGKQLCDNPQNIECRAQLYRDVPISQLQQKLLCNIKDGLQCRDWEQMGKMKKCLNYEARFYCCDYAHCRTTSTQGTMTIATSTSTEASTPGTTLGQTSASPSSSAGSTPGPTLRPSTQGTTVATTSPGKETTTTLSTSLSTAQATSPGAVSTPSVTSATASTATATSLQSTPVSKPTGSIPTEGTTPQVSSTTIVTPIGSTTSSVTEAISTVCQPECTWTAWFDVSDPENGEGDMETPEEIRKAGKQLCDNPQDIECRAQLYHDVPISQLQQKVLCNIKDGLQCRDREQMGKMKKCLNYEARFYCCDYAHCQTTSTQGTMTIATSSSTEASTHGTTLGQTSSSPSSSAGSTPGPTLRPSTTGTTLVATSPGKETTTTLSTSLSTAQATSPGAVSTPSVTSATASTATATSLQSTPVSKPTGSIPTEGTTPQVSSTAVGTTTIVTPIGSTTSSVTEAISTVCHPECTWTAWFDVSDPENGEGDMETPEEIRKAGKQLCDNPQNIECRAQLYHDVPISHLQQKVLCNIKDGLQCRDWEQMGKMKKCLNYEARFYCCDYAHCRTTSTQGTMTIATSTSTEASTPGTTLGQTSASPSSSAGSTPGPTLQPSTQGTTVATTSPASATKTATASSTLTSSRITPCFCHVSGAAGGLFSPGEVIYNKTDSSGCRFYAICDNNCEVKRSQEPCPSTTPSHPPTPSVTTVGTSSIPSAPTPTILIPSTIERTSLAPSTGPVVKPTTPVQDCPNVDPPRKINETWMLNNCSMATCEGNNRIVVVLPPPVDKITCVNRLPPVKINHDDGCTYHYDCTCVCSGWDNSHYETFDGTDYTFHDNCTYVLVQEIVKKHGNFSVLVDNYYCDPANNQSCSRSIIIHYNHVEVVLSSQMYNGMRTNKVIFNKETVHASFSKDGIIVADTGTSMSVEILEIHAFINFNGFTFSIKVPFDLFAFNTEGQCGTCSNDRSDDCRLPNGHKASSCSEMAPHWKVNDSCVKPTPTPEPTGATPTPSEITCTTPSPLCELIVSDIFADCHKVLPPKVFYDHCLSEACQNANDSLTCYSIEMYASLCIDKGFCSDWRSKTKGKCPYHCPKGKVYEACGPVYPATCDNRKANDITEHVAEGCFCPADQILVNSYSDTCVPDCNFCIGPEGLPKMPGTKWKSNCEECICHQLSVTVQCKRQPCPTPVMPACEKEGFMPVSVLTPEDPCCSEIQCLCNVSACSNDKKSCEAGYRLASVLFEGDCCVTFLCEPIPDICLVNGTVYTPGVSIPSENCEACVCGNETDPSSKRNLVECEPIPCDTACSVGYEYQVKTGECCGTCVQVTCTININGTTQMLKPGDVWQPEGNNCSQYECEKEDNELVLVNTRRTCPIFDPQECGPDETELTPDGCCKICKPQNCKVQRNQILIRQNECVSSELVELTYCEGTCPSSSMYSTEARAMQHKCTCCQELKSHKKEVSLTCQDGRTINYDYIYVDECQCMTACIPETTTRH
ncbi:mucin-5B-like isoform X1 [Eublepharis macularius]|uniref:Mucin-5B-like isoform X1 n=1 Tax=Eublepharis macularius TaxID=481883 RepID=A0AA97KR83_EUBMA|nr:mucin-5B-like isoform X1 [Eublepharis macularius]